MMTVRRDHSLIYNTLISLSGLECALWHTVMNGDLDHICAHIG